MRRRILSEGMYKAVAGPGNLTYISLLLHVRIYLQALVSHVYSRKPGRVHTKKKQHFYIYSGKPGDSEVHTKKR